MKTPRQHSRRLTRAAWLLPVLLFIGCPSGEESHEGHDHDGAGEEHADHEGGESAEEHADHDGDHDESVEDHSGHDHDGEESK